jgi:hypothetical protein
MMCVKETELEKEKIDDMVGTLIDYSMAIRRVPVGDLEEAKKFIAIIDAIESAIGNLHTISPAVSAINARLSRCK